MSLETSLVDPEQNLHEISFTYNEEYDAFLAAHREIFNRRLRSKDPEDQKLLARESDLSKRLRVLNYKDTFTADETAIGGIMTVLDIFIQRTLKESQHIDAKTTSFDFQASSASIRTYLGDVVARDLLGAFLDAFPNVMDIKIEDFAPPTLPPDGAEPSQGSTTDSSLPPQN